MPLAFLSYISLLISLLGFGYVLYGGTDNGNGLICIGNSPAVVGLDGVGARKAIWVLVVGKREGLRVDNQDGGKVHLG